MRIRHFLAALALGLLAPVAHAGDEEVVFVRLPSQVQETVGRHVADGTISQIDIEQEQQQTVYEVEFVRGDMKWEMDVAPNGRLLELKRN